MEKSQNQKYVASLFFGGLGADIDPELLDSKTGAYLEAHYMQMSRTWKNVLQTMRGDKSFGTILPGFPSIGGVTTDDEYVTTDSETVTTDSGGVAYMNFIGGVWLNGYVVTFYRDIIADLTYIYANSLLIGQSADLPRAMLDSDTNSETWEIVVTDNVTVPIVLDLQDMLAHAADQTYFTDYNFKLYSVNKPLQLNQPVFVQLDDLGAAGGLKIGSYAYAMAYASKSGEQTPWGPVTPYIPVPESGVSLVNKAVDGYARGLKTWGGQTSLTPGRYGIRLKLRIANMSGFDYIKIKRYANNTGQPISYTPTAEFIILTTDSDGSLIDIKADPYTVIDFTDSNSKDWAILDESVSSSYSTIKTSRTARFYDRRIILGGIVYESKLLTDKDIFITEPNVNRIAFPIVKTLESGLHVGFSDIYNQVYYKSLRCGEKYGFGAELHDEQGNKLFTVPLKMQEAKDDFTNFQIPNRRDKIPTGVKRVDTIILLGSIGSADILCNGLIEPVTFRTSTTQTATDFVIAHAADYLVTGVVVTSYLDRIIFTSIVAGVDFTGPTLITTQADGNLIGSVITTQENGVPTAQVDLVLFNSAPGTALISCRNWAMYVERSVYYSGSNATAAAQAYVTANHEDFVRIGVEISVYIGSMGAGVLLTGPSSGTAITTVASGALVLTVNPVATTTAAVQARPRIDTITFSPVTPVGAIDITCHGITRTMTWDRTWYNTISTFISTYAADYLPSVVVSLDMLNANKIIFTGYFSEATTVATHTASDLAGTIVHTQPNIAGNPQIDDVVFDTVGAVTGVQCDVTGGGSYSVEVEDTTPPRVVTAFLAEETLNHGWAANGITIAHGGSAGALRFTGPNGKAVTVTVICTAYHVNRIQNPSAGIAQIDTLTFTGTVGNALVTAGGISRSITLTSSLAATALKFYSDYQSTYAAVGISILNSSNTVVFTALTAGDGFTTTIANVPDTLFGSPAVTQTSATAVPQVDTVTLSGVLGTANITCQGLTHSITFSISLDVTAINFYTNFKDEYLALKGVTVGYSGGNITFTGPADGSAIVTTATGSLVDNIYTTVASSVGIAQIDKVTITGTTGNAIITCDSKSLGIPYWASPTDTAALFVLWYAAAFAPSIGVTSIGPDIYFTKLTGIGVPFSSTTTIVHSVSDLHGDVEHTRANASGGGELDASTGKFRDSTVESWNADVVDYVYDPVSAKGRFKQDNNKILNIISVGDPSNSKTPIPYSPVTPVGRGSSPNENTYDDITQMNIMDTVDSYSDNVGQYGSNISTIGLRIGGIDVTKLPSNVKSFSIVRTPAAGRVVCQGIGMYALTEQVYGSTSPSLVKALDKLWFYSPELDPVIGTKGGVYEDIKANPDNYQIQLVAPCGFFSDFYSAYPTNVAGIERNQDMVSMPICGAGADARKMFPPDAAETNYISFGKWRNTNQGTGIDATLTFDISLAEDVPHAKIRVPYLEMTLSSNIYYSANVVNHDSSNADAKAFHEPWYIINIIQSREVPNNNVNSYNDIGHSIRLESVVGIASGKAEQQFSLVEERREDVLSTGETASTYRYIWVDDKPWLESHDITALVTHLTAIEAVGYCTPSGGLQCYGIFTLSPNNIIVFDKVLPISGIPVAPVAGARVVVKYNNNSPIEVFLGDTYVADASFLAVDVKSPGDDFRLQAPMPHFDFTFKTTYHQAYFPEVGGVHSGLTPPMGIWEDQGTHNVSYLRQWLINFTCESTVNLPLAYKNFFPSRLYAMRPMAFTERLDTETLNEYFVRMKIYPQYNDDYPDEYLKWIYGGLSTPASANFDYEKILPLKAYAEPQSGAHELLSLMKRLHWGTQRIPGFESNRVFLPTNIYDLKNDKASQISILYDQYSERGSNLYAITDRGAALLLVDKNMITTAEGNNLTILAENAGFIKGEVWLSNSIGCPKEFWRGKSEGAVKLPNNVVASILVFPSDDDIVMLTNNNFVKIADNMRQSIVSSLEAITDTNKLYSVIDEGENKLWITIGSTTYSFNFDVNNWDGFVRSVAFDKSFNARYLEGVDDKNVLAHALNTSTQFGLSISHKGSGRFSTIGDVPYVVFSVTPELGRGVEFIDMFISASAKPYSMQFATTKDFTDPITILGTKLQDYEGGLYYLQGISRSTGGKRMMGKTLYVKISFPDTLQMYNLKLVKIGYKNISGN